MNDEGLRELYAENMDLFASEKGAPCPPLEQLSALVEGTIPETERLSLLDHVMACRTCQQEFELLRSMKAAAPRPRWGWRQLSLAASIVLVAGSGVLWTVLSPDVRETPIYRSGAADFALVSPADGEGVVLPALLTWQTLPRAIRYEVEVLDPIGSLAVSALASDTVLTLTSDGSVPPGEYRWYVTATLDDGIQVRTAPRRLIISPR